jgi:para-aminobenzoate synthetase/4-amino-4-deoxychorismate lyase
MEAHLGRLTDSLDELFPGLATPDLGQMEIQMESGVMRIVVVPGADRFEMKVSFRETEERFGPVALHSLVLTGGLGPHKWADRSLLDEAQDTLPEGALPLLVDEQGFVLEASRANVFAVRDGVLLTPPLDGRILPGVTRMRVIESAGGLGTEAPEPRLHLNDLLGADEVFLTGSVRGIERVGAIDGTVLATGGNVTSELSAELRRTWVRAKVG